MWKCKKCGCLNFRIGIGGYVDVDFNKYGEEEIYKNTLEIINKECFRVLEVNGILVFKWNEEQIKLNEILKLTDIKPLFGNKRAKTHWLVFMKEE